jgi:DNA polymerase delta subunit 2
VAKSEKTKLTLVSEACDELFESFSAFMSVDLMPGKKDPSDWTLPQQPIQRLFFPRACAVPNFSRVTNPHSVSVDGVTMLGESGQALDNVSMFTKSESRLELAKRIVTQWRHFAPTAPDLLNTFPADYDPFILETLPHVLFFGNQKEFATTLVEGESGQKVRLVLLPAFSSKATIALVNLRTLECQPMEFQLYSS